MRCVGEIPSILRIWAPGGDLDASGNILTFVYRFEIEIKKVGHFRFWVRRLDLFFDVVFLCIWNAFWKSREPDVL
jgi:hypothetical protein